MGELRDRFWELPLEALTRAEWEALCDGCGQCCLHKLEDEDTGEILRTNVACRLLDTETGRCKDYRLRRALVPDCLTLSMRLLRQVCWLPESCAYRLRAEGIDLPAWHPLIVGNDTAIVDAGISVRGRVVSEDVAGPLEHHIVEWDKVTQAGAMRRGCQSCDGPNHETAGRGNGVREADLAENRAAP